MSKRYIPESEEFGMSPDFPTEMIPDYPKYKASLPSPEYPIASYDVFAAKNTVPSPEYPTEPYRSRSSSASSTTLGSNRSTQSPSDCLAEMGNSLNHAYYSGSAYRALLEQFNRRLHPSAVGMSMPSLGEWLTPTRKISAGKNGVLFAANLGELEDLVVIKVNKKENESADMLIEYNIQNQLNVLRAELPNFVLALGHFRCGLINSETGDPSSICDPTSPAVNYILMEKVETTPDGRTFSLADLHKAAAKPFIYTDEITYLSYILQIAHALQTAQDRYEFTHYDLHLGNVLIQRLPASLPQVMIQYPGGHAVRTSYIAVIIDFGFARLRDEHGTIIVRRGNFTDYGIFPDFNPAYDIFMLIVLLYKGTTEAVRAFLRPLVQFLESRNPFARIDSQHYLGRLLGKYTATGKLVPETLNGLRPIDVVEAIASIYPKHYAFLSQAPPDIPHIPVPDWEAYFGSLNC